MKVVVIGAGVTGLTAALDLIEAGHQVTVYEAGASVGGLAGGFKSPRWDWSVEHYYHHWFTSDTQIKTLLSHLGWSHDFRVYNPKTVIYYQGKFYRLDSVPAIFTFPGFNVFDALRFGAITAYLKFIARWQTLEQYTAHSWLFRFYGKKIYSLIWQPMLQGKFGPFYQKVTMAWMWARLKARTTKLATFTGGFQNFLDRFAAALKQKGVKLHLNSPVQRINAVDGKVLVTLKHHKRVFDSCLVTVPPFVFTKITPRLPADLKSYWQNIPTLGALLVMFSLKHPLSKEGYYWYNLPKSGGFPFLALVEHTHFISPSVVGGDHLIYCGDYLPATDPRFKMAPSELTSLYQTAFKKINPDFDPSWITATWVSKTPYAQPVPFPGSGKKIPPLQTPLHGVFYASMNHIYPWDRGTNYAVGLGHQAADLIQKASHV